MLTNEGFTRGSDGTNGGARPGRCSAYANSVNSVIYFACCPISSNDRAVIRNISGGHYRASPYQRWVTFRQEGGDEFEDEYLYWFP